MTQRDRARISLVKFDGDGPAPVRVEERPLPWLLRSRLAPPRLVDVVARPRLLDRCLGAATGDSVLLLAPPGYGKTTLLAQLNDALLARERSVVWLTLSEREDTPEGFVTALSHAVTQGLRGPRADSHETAGDVEQRLAAIVDVLAEERSVHLILDEVDALHDFATLDMLDRMAANLPPGATLCMSGRRYTGARFRKLISERKVWLLSTDDLRFDQNEIAAVLDCLPPAAAQRLLALTGGFPVACRLMGDVARKRAALDADQAFDLMRPLLAQWFDEQVLAGVDSTELGFLMDSGVLGQFTLEILEQVPDRAYGWSDLEKTMQGGNYLAAVESQPGWFGYAGLFAQHLVARLRRADPPRLALLHRFAADWFAKRAQPVDAIRHAAETGDPIFAAQVTESLGAIALGFEKGAWILSYSRDVPQGCTQEFPLVALGQVYLSLEEGRFREARAAFERLKGSPSFGRLLTLEEPWTSEVGTLALLVEEVLRIYEDQPAASREAETLGRCLQTWQHGGSPVLAASVAAALSAVYLNLHRFEEAASTADRGRLALRDAGHCQASFVLRIIGALSALALGHLREAALQVECAALAAASVADPQGKQAGYADLVRAQLHYEANELDAAWSVLKTIPARPEMLMNAWFELQAGVFDAAAALAAIREGPEAVRAVIHEAKRIARARGLARLSIWADVLLVREFVREGRHEEASEMLDGETLRELLTPGGRSERADLRIRSELLLAAARLMVALGRHREAEDYLSRISCEFVGSGDVRLSMEYGIVAMISAFRLRRYAQACRQLVSVVMTGVETGMTRRLSDHREQLLQIGDWMRRVGRPVPAKVASFLAQIRNDAAVRDAARTGIYQITARPRDPVIGGCLTQREADVLALLADGLTSKEIASRLAITEGTVKTHRKKINRKLNVGSRSLAVAAARRMLLV